MKRFLLYIYEPFIALPILLSLTILTAVTTIIGCAFGRNSIWGYYPAKIWSRLFCFFSMVKVEVIGRENISPKESYIFVSNHQGAFDIFLIYGYLNHNFKWVMKQSLRSIPLVGKACQSAGHLFIDRGNPKSILRTIDTARETLQGGMSVVIFPEGTRSTDGTMHKFKRGAFQLAADLKIPVVPLTINGSYKIMSKSSSLINPGKLTLVIHRPIKPDPETGYNLNDLAEKSCEIISSGLL